MATDTLQSPAILGYTPTKVLKNFIDGEWVESSTGETFEEVAERRAAVIARGRAQR